LIAEWCGGRRFRWALKTDVFDESVGGGCCDALAAVKEEKARAKGVGGCCDRPEV
jgi:hypothetical protein